MAVRWEQEQPDGKAVTSSTSEAVSEITLNPDVMQIPPAPEGWSLLLLLNTSSRRRGRGNVVIPKGYCHFHGPALEARIKLRRFRNRCFAGAQRPS